MIKSKINKVLLLMLISINVYAENINTLLDAYADNNDLSEKTKLENSGTVMVFSRKDLEIMQVRNLRDIMKSIPVVGYNESRFVVPDSLYNGSMKAFSSSKIRLFIDDHEVTSGMSSSGFALMGNIDLGFVNHIEVYTQSPSFEYASEPAHLLIKLYSKSSQRDAGGKLELSTGSRGFNQESAYYAEELEDYSYMVYLSRLDDQREDLGTNADPLGRNLERYNLFATLSTQNHKFQMNVLDAKQESFAGPSLDATPSISEYKYSYVSLGYTYNYDDRFFISLSGERIQSLTHFQDDPEYKDSDLSFLYKEYKDDAVAYDLLADVKYIFNMEKSKLIVGLKNEHKFFDYQSREISGLEVTSPVFDNQNISTLYFEEQYFMNDFNILNMGVKYSHLHSNGLLNEENLLFMRLGHTYTSDAWVFKTFMHYSENSIEVLDELMYLNVQAEDGFKAESTITFTEEVKYSHKAHDVKMLLNYSMVKDSIQSSASNTFSNYNEDIFILNPQFQYTYKFDVNHKLLMGLSYSKMTHIPHIDTIEYYDGFIRTLNRFNDWDLFAELVYNHNNAGLNGYDVSMGAKYSFSDDLMLSIKGENIFGTAEESAYMRFSTPAPTYQPVHAEPLMASPIEQRMYMTVEYQF